LIVRVGERDVAARKCPFGPVFWKDHHRDVAGWCPTARHHAAHFRHFGGQYHANLWCVREHLDRNGVAYDIDPTLVRGLDYYTRTVFEFECDRLGAQSGIGGGGRYDGLIEQLGGPATAGCGWALGVDRIALALQDAEDAEDEGERDGVFIVAESADRDAALALVTELRRAGLAADLDLADRAIKGQMKQADRVGARYALILSGGGNATLRDMSSGEERDIDPSRVAEEIRT
jgi:histidyl-tRNA synthetase